MNANTVKLKPYPPPLSFLSWLLVLPQLSRMFWLTRFSGLWERTWGVEKSKYRGQFGARMWEWWGAWAVGWSRLGQIMEKAPPSLARGQRAGQLEHSGREGNYFLLTSTFWTVHSLTEHGDMENTFLAPSKVVSLGNTQEGLSPASCPMPHAL